MKRHLYALRFALLAALAVASAAPLSAQSGAGQVSLAIGTQAPAVMLEDLEGKPVNLQDLIRG